MKYARVLISHCPDATTQLFIDYYTASFKPKPLVEEVKEEITLQPTGGVVQKNIASLIPLPYRTSGTSTPAADVVKSPPAEPQVTAQAETPATYEVPKPRTAFSSFVDHPQQFITFLEALIKQTGLLEEDKVDLYTTLFEMYLDTAKSQKDPSEKEKWEAKAKQLIQGRDVSIYTPSTRTQEVCLILARHPCQPQTLCSCPTCPTSARAPPLFENKKGSGQISCDLT